MEHTHHTLDWLSPLIGEPLERLLESAGLPQNATHFFVHALVDFMSIALLLIVVVTAVSYLQTYVPYERMRDRLKGLSGAPGYALALGLGLLSPFCSCTIIPILMGFLASGVPLSFCLVFLTSASCLNLTALSAIFAAFDLSFAMRYAVCAAVICVVTGLALGRGGERFIRMDRLHAEHHHHHNENTVGSRLNKAFCSAFLTLGKIWPFLLLGVAVSAALSAFVPQEWIARALTGNPYAALPLAALLGGCLHSDVFSILPIVHTLFDYSAAVALTFLLSVMLFSIAEWALLSQSFRPRLIARYCALLLSLALLSGLLTLWI